MTSTRKRLVALVAVGAFSGAAIGVPAQATPSGSQNLRGMAGRVFAVRVTVSPPVVAPFTNCYRFGVGDRWDDDALDIASPGHLQGKWTQGTTGASTPYSASVDYGADGRLVQTGTVTPVLGSGVLQLSATTVVPKAVLGLELMLTAVGAEATTCATDFRLPG